MQSVCFQCSTAVFIFANSSCYLMLMLAQGITLHVMGSEIHSWYLHLSAVGRILTVMFRHNWSSWKSLSPLLPPAICGKKVKSIEGHFSSCPCLTSAAVDWAVEVKWPFM